MEAISNKETGVPVYKEAVKVFSDESLLKDALESGAKGFLKKSPAEINRELANFADDAERQMYRLGAVQSVRDDIYGMKETGDIAGKFINSREMRDRMRTVFNSEGEYEAFVKNLERERQMAITRSRIEGGSITTPLAQDVAEMAGPSPTNLIGAGAQMAGGNVLGGMTDLYRQLGQPDLDRSQNARMANLAARGISDLNSGAGANLMAQLGDQTNRFGMGAAQRGIAQGNIELGQQND